MTEIYEYPKEWYRFTKQTFVLRSKSQVSARPWAGGNSVYGPHVQMWMPQFSGVVTEKFLWQKVSAFFSRLGGQAGLIRMGHGLRLRPQYNRANRASSQAFSDSTTFTDGTGFLSGLLPSTAYVLARASRGDMTIQIGGLPASITDALQRGDLLEFRPNGIADATPRLHEVMVNGSTNSDGQTGIEIRPALRTDLAVGDMVVLENPSSVFHLVDDQQGDMAMTVASQGAFGFSLIEAVENVDPVRDGWHALQWRAIAGSAIDSNVLQSDIGTAILADVGTPILVQ
jgi:hypothetical protein